VNLKMKGVYKLVFDCIHLHRRKEGLEDKSYMSTRK